MAVVALLKELGASKALGTLIEGESLLNDGSAVVLFIWVRNVIGYTVSTDAPAWMQSGELSGWFAELFRVLAQMLFFGVVFGLACGKFTVFACALLYNKLTIEGPVVLAMSYLCFWLGELICGTSAVISVVVMGLYVNYYRAHISAEVFHFLHEFYEMVAHILNTVIFAIAGAKLGMLLIDGSTQEIIGIYPQIFLIYPIVLFTRGLAILIAFPLLKRMGTGATWRDAVIMWWGGLRGSVGLALALVIQHTIYDEVMWGKSEYAIGEHKSLNCRDQPLVVVAMTLLVVMLTVVVNGVTMAPLMRLLKMTDVTASRKVMINGSYAKLEKETDHCLGSLKGEETFFRGVDWESVKDMNFSDYDNPAMDCVPKAAWMSALSIERASYLRQFERGLLSTDGFAALERFMATLLADADKIDPSRELSQRDRVERGIDENEKGALTQRYHSGILEMVQEHTRGALNVRKLALESQLREAEEACAPEEEVVKLEEERAEVEKRIGRGEENAMRLSDRVLAYHIAKAYLIGQMDVKKAMELYHKEQTKGGKAAAAAAAGVHASVAGMNKGKATAEAIFHEMQAVVTQHSSMLDAMNALLATADQPGSAQGRYVAWKSRYVAELLLLEQREVVEHLQHAGLLDELDAAPLKQQLDHRIGKIILAPLAELMHGLRSRLLAALHLIPRLPTGSPTATATAELVATAASEPSPDEEPSAAPELSRLSSREASARGVVIPRGSIAMGGGAGKGGLGLLRETSIGSIFGRRGMGTIANLLRPESSRMQESSLTSVGKNDSPSDSRKSSPFWAAVREQTEVGVAPKPLIDVDATATAIGLATRARNESHDASYTLLHAGDTFGSEWFDALRAVGSDTAEVGSQLDMVMIGDFGRDQDDEKALAMAVAMRRLGLIGNLWVIANMGDSVMRARLAKGTVSALGANDVRVAKGSRGGESAKQSKFAYEFDCPYLAEESELDELAGHELAFAAIEQARSEDHKLAFVLCSACTDMAAILRDERWERTAPGVVSHVTAMGGADILADGSIQMSIDGSNNKFDPAAASFVYSTLNADRRFWLIVVTRFAAAACQLPRSSFDGSVHPMARRLSAVMAPSLQKLWERCHLTEIEPQPQP